MILSVCFKRIHCVIRKAKKSKEFYAARLRTVQVCIKYDRQMVWFHTLGNPADFCFFLK